MIRDASQISFPDSYSLKSVIQVFSSFTWRLKYFLLRVLVFFWIFASKAWAACLRKKVTKNCYAECESACMLLYLIKSYKVCTLWWACKLKWQKKLVFLFFDLLPSIYSLISFVSSFGLPIHLNCKWWHFLFFFKLNFQLQFSWTLLPCSYFCKDS